jgi:hypothetical protein
MTVAPIFIGIEVVEFYNLFAERNPNCRPQFGIPSPFIVNHEFRMDGLIVTLLKAE